MNKLSPNMIRFIGDIHGHWHEYKTIAKDIEHRSVQVGDFGVGFQGPYWHDRANDFHTSGQHRFIRGNHDNPDMCKNDMVGCITDGTVETNIMYIGGAWSIDQDYRTPGISWWADEELSQGELDHMHSIYAMMQPEIMVTHDCPTLAAYYMFIKDGQSLAQRTMYLTRTGEALQRMFEVHQPKLWIHGHWHLDRDRVINGTRFICLGINGWVDVDTQTMDIRKPSNFED